MRCRGLAYFDATKPLAQPTVAGSTPVLPAQVAPGAACQRRILMNTIDGKLIALDADNGKFCRTSVLTAALTCMKGWVTRQIPPTC